MEQKTAIKINTIVGEVKIVDNINFRNLNLLGVSIEFRVVGIENMSITYYKWEFEYYVKIEVLKMKRYLRKILIIIIVFLALKCTYVFWFGSVGKTQDIVLNEENIIRIHKTFEDLKLPEKAKIEKATTVVANGTRIYVKVLIPIEKIDEFKSEYQYYKKETVSELDIEIYKDLQARKIKWWDINEANVDYKIKIGWPGSKEIIFCKPENDLVPIYFKT